MSTRVSGLGGMKHRRQTSRNAKPRGDVELSPVVTPAAATTRDTGLGVSSLQERRVAPARDHWPMSARERPRTTRDVSFRVERVSAMAASAAPMLSFQLAIEAGSEEAIRSILLSIQIRIDVRRWASEVGARERLAGVVDGLRDGEASTGSLLWTQELVAVPPFAGKTEIEIPVACTYDFEVATTRYFDAVGDGEIPLQFLFSGTALYELPDGALEAVIVPLDRDATFRLPAALWREAMEDHFPNSAWILIPRETFNALHRFKSEKGLHDLDTSIKSLLEGSSEETR